jgi:carboxypeptidase C (cathepsin A)
LLAPLCWPARTGAPQANDFFVAGESYAGVYVPLVGRAVLDGNEAGQEPALRLRGYIVGNGVTDERFDGDALVPFAYGKSLIRCAAASLGAARIAEALPAAGCPTGPSRLLTAP